MFFISGYLTWISYEVLLTPTGRMIETLLEKTFVFVSCINVLISALFLLKKRHMRVFLSLNLHLLLLILCLLFARSPDFSLNSLPTVMFVMVPVLFCIIILHNKPIIDLLHNENKVDKSNQGMVFTGKPPID